MQGSRSRVALLLGQVAVTLQGGSWQALLWRRG